jgi:hypothetical protein
MNKILFILLPLLIVGSFVFGQSYNNIGGKQNFLDSIKMQRLKNNSSGSFVVGTDTTGKLILVAGGGGGSSSIGQTIKLSGNVIWDSAFVFHNTIITYQILGRNFSTPASTFTITAADATLNRYTVVVADTLGHLSTIDGTAGAIANIPIVNPVSQILLATYYVPAASTQPSGISNTTVYKENVEWVLGGTVTGLSGTYPTAPYAGLYSTRVPSVTAGQYFNYTNGATVSAADYTFLDFELRLGAAFNSTTNLVVTFYNGTTPVSNPITLLNGTYGYSSGISGAYQLIVIPINSFAFTNANFDNIRFTLTGSNVSGLQVDNVILQSGGSNSSGSGVNSVDGMTGNVITNYFDSAVLSSDSLYYNFYHRGNLEYTLPSLKHTTVAKAPLIVIPSGNPNIDTLAISGILPADSTITWSVNDSLSTPPASPNAGNIYLVGTSPTGAFTGKANYIATFDGTSYTFHAPTVGDKLYNAATNVVSQWTGVDWVRISGSIPSGGGQANHMALWTANNILGPSQQVF